MTGDLNRSPAGAVPARLGAAGSHSWPPGVAPLSAGGRARWRAMHIAVGVALAWLGVASMVAPTAPVGASGITATPGPAPLATPLPAPPVVASPTPDPSVAVATSINLATTVVPTGTATPGGATSPADSPTGVATATRDVTPVITALWSPTVTASVAVTASVPATVSPTASATATASVTSTTTATASVTSTTTATATRSATVTRVPTGLAAWRARNLVRVRDFDAAPSVDLDLVPVTSTVLGPGQVAAFDLMVRAGTTEVLVVDAHLDLDPTRVQVVSVDRPDGGAYPLPQILSEQWDNDAGTVHLAYGTIVGETEPGASGYFRLARLGVRATPGVMAGLTGPTTATIGFASNGDANRQTAIYGRTSSLLRNVTPLAISLNPLAGVVPAFATPDATTLYQGIPGEVAFTVLDARNARLASASFTASLTPPSAGTVIVSSGTTTSNGVASVRVRPNVSSGTGVVDLTVTSSALPGGSVRLSRLAAFGAPLPVEAAVELPEADGRVGGRFVPVRAATKAGPGALPGTTVEVDWSWSKDGGATFAPFAGTPTVPSTGSSLLAGTAVATWDTTESTLAPPGSMAEGVIVKAAARAMFEGVVVGQGEGTVGGITVDNYAPTIDFPRLGNVSLVDDLATKHWFRERSPVLTGEAEVGVTIRVWRIDQSTGARRTPALASCVVPCGVSGATTFRAIPGAVDKRAFSTFALPVPFTEADEVPSGLYVQVDAVDQKGLNVGPALVEVGADGKPVVVLQPIDVWVGIDTVAPRVARIDVPTTVASATDPPSTVTVGFTEPVRLMGGDTTSAWSTSDVVRLTHLISDAPVTVDAAISIACASPAPVPATPLPPATVTTQSVRAGANVGVRATCADGVSAVTFTLASRPYPGGTYIVAVPGAFVDRAGNAIDPVVAANPVTWKGPGTAPLPLLDIVGLADGVVLHGTATTPVLLAVTATNVDSQVTWRLCADVTCSSGGGLSATLGHVGVSDTYRWDTTATDLSGVRLYPDRRDVTLVAEAENTRLAGSEGKVRHVRAVTLRSVAPALVATDLAAFTCTGGRADAPATAIASTTFNIARGDCAPDVDGLQVRLGTTITDSVGGSVDLLVQVGGGAPTPLATGVPVSAASGTWQVGVTLPQGAVTLTARARDVAFPVPNVAPDAVASFIVDTVAPVTTLSYPPDSARLAASGITLPVPVIGATEPGSAVTLSLARDGEPLDGFPRTITAGPSTGQAPFRYPATGGVALSPGLYVLGVATVDPNGNPGAMATRSFRVTPPPVAGSLDALGEVGAAQDADPDVGGIQVVVTGRLPAGTTAAQVPDGMIARLRRNGDDAIGDGNRPVVAPVTFSGGTWGFAFPPLTFTDDVTTSFTVVTVDDAGNRSAESAPVTLVVDTSPPPVRLAAPAPGSAVGTTTPELAVVVGTRPDGTFDAASATFLVRPSLGASLGPAASWQMVKTIAIDPQTLATAIGGAGVLRVDQSAWSAPLSEPVAPEKVRTYDLRVAVADALGNVRTVDGTFVLQPGAPEVRVSAGGARVIGNLDITTETVPLVEVSAAAVGAGVSIVDVGATIRQRGATASRTVAVTGAGGQRTLELGGITLANGTVHDLAVTATDSEGRATTASIALRVVRPRDLVVVVTRGATPVVGASVRLRRDAADLPAVARDATSGANGAAPTFAGLPGGPVLIAVGDVPGYPVTTLVAQVTEPRAPVGTAWTINVDLDALNPNTITVAVRGMPSSVTSLSATDLASALRIDVEPGVGTRLADALIGLPGSGVTRVFGDDIARVDRSFVAPTLTVAGSVVSAVVRVPVGAAAWRVSPAVSTSLAAIVAPKGAAEATAVFTAAPATEPLPVSLRFVPRNLLVKTLGGTVTRPDGSGVAGATVVVSRAGGLSVSTVTSVDGTFGPLALEAGEYVIAPLAAPGADWVPARAARVTFADGDQVGDAESATVDVAVEAAGGTLQGRLTKLVSGTSRELTTGTIVLQGGGYAITAVAGSSVLPGQDATSGANFSVQAPSGGYIMTVIPDDPTRTPPDPLAVRLVDGRVSVIAPTDLPSLERTLARADGVVRLASGATLAGVVVQARLEGSGSVVPATTDAGGRFRLALEPGTWTVGAIVSPGSTFMPGIPVPLTVAGLATVTMPDLVLPEATATIERTFAKAGNGTATVAFTDDEAAEIAGTAFIKDEATGTGASVAFQGARLRVSVPAGRYRLGIAINAGGYLAPEAESGVIATVGTPNIATLTVGTISTTVGGQIVTGQTGSSAGTPVAVRAIIRATGLAGAAAGTVITAASGDNGAFTFRLAPGAWRLAASPGASSGYVASADRPWTDITVGTDGSVTPATAAINVDIPTRVIAGSVVTESGGASVKLAGVRVAAEVLGTSGGVTVVESVTGRDGAFALRLPPGAATLLVSGANARYATAGTGHAAGDPAHVVDPVPSGAPTADGPVTISLEATQATVSGTVSGNGAPVAGATVVATLRTTGQVRVSTSLGGARTGEWSLRLSRGTWSVVASADLVLAGGARVPASSVATEVVVAEADRTGVNLVTVAGASTLPPSASAPALPETGGLVRAGRGSAEIRIAPGAVAQPVTVTVEPLGSVPAIPGFVPFGDAFRLSAVTSSGVPVANLAVDSPLLITYPRADLSGKRAPSTATHGQTTAQPSDLRPARYDAVTGSYAAMSGAVATLVDAATGLFTVPTLTLGTFVLTSREALVAVPSPPPSGGGGGGGSAAPAVVVRPVAVPIATPTPVAPLPAASAETAPPSPLPAVEVTALPAPRIPASFVVPGSAGAVPIALVPDPFGILADGRIDARAVVPPGGLTVVVPVTVEQVVSVEVPADGAVVAFVAPRFAGIDGGSVVVRVPATLMARVLALAPGSRTTLRFDPAPPLASDAQRGFLGGGNVVPLGTPIDLRLETRDAGGVPVDLGALRTSVDGVSTAPGVDVAVPVPARFVGADLTFACLVGLYEPGIGGGFLGYGRLPAPYDVASVTHVLTIDVDGLTGTLLLPSELRVAYVSNFDPDAHLWSNPTALAIDLGPIGGPVTPMRVVGPQVGTRIFVSNPRSGGVGWVDAAAVGPEDPAKANLPLLPPAEATLALPSSVKTNSATVHVYAHEGPAAIDFGLVGPSGTALTVIGPALEGRVFVFNPVTENYGWVNLAEVVTLEGVPVGGTASPASPEPNKPPVPVTGDVVTLRNGVRLWSNATSTAVDFGEVGPEGTRLTLAGPREGPRALVFNPKTENYGWIDIESISAPRR